MSEWQDISTAPRDGTPILIFQPSGRYGQTVSHYMPPDALKPGEGSYRTDDPRLKLYDDARWAIGYWRPWGGWGNRNSSDVEPSHWMPLPAPPQQSQEE